jgi:hypothetical protein
MKYGILILLLLISKLSLASLLVNQEPKYSTQEFIQTYCVMEYCPEHINDSEYEKQKNPNQKCYADCCEKHGGCANSSSQSTDN